MQQSIATLSLTDAEAGWFAGIVSDGYTAAVLPLVTQTDRISSHTIFLARGTLAKIQSQFKTCAAETKLPYAHLSRICAMCDTIRASDTSCQK